MANENVPRLRPLADPPSDEDVRDGRFTRDPAPAREPVPAPERSDAAEPPVSDRGPEDDPETPEERAARELAEWKSAVDNTEIVDRGVSTPAYRRAMALFDEEDPRLQLGDFWDYRDHDFEKHGRF